MRDNIAKNPDLFDALDLQNNRAARMENNWNLKYDSFSNHQSQSSLDVDPGKPFIEAGAILKELEDYIYNEEWSVSSNKHYKYCVTY